MMVVIILKIFLKNPEKNDKTEFFSDLSFVEEVLTADNFSGRSHIQS